MQTVWDPETQEVHGGQTWRSCERFTADFSVTTNGLGPPLPATNAAISAIADMHHYPAADNALPLCALSEFTKWPADKLLLGNGASEFIDLVMKALPPGPFRPGPFKAAYMEYNRAAIAAGRQVLEVDSRQHAAVTVIIHPNSPTGDFLSLADIEHLLAKNKGAFVIDESFMPFMGHTWREHSALQLVDKYADRLLVLASWTKLWACPGLRLGSLAAGETWIRKIKAMQTPWSCNVAAQAFCTAAAKDMEYMRDTWASVKEWRAGTERGVKRIGWKVHNSPAWVPWVFVYCPDADVAARAVRVAQTVGCPVRGCASFGLPHCLRVGLRRGAAREVLFTAWETHFVKHQK